MPKRMVDGDRIWTSDRIARIEPEDFRAEYANLLPLALANGSFECSAKRVWRDVYSYNRPSFDVQRVGAVLLELERVRLLFRWSEDDRVWGFWVGITSEGLLPAKAHINRGDYKKGKEPPQDLLSRFLRGEIESGLDADLPQGDPRGSTGEPPVGIGLDRLGRDRIGGAETQPTSQELENGQEEDVRATKQIPVICQAILGTKADMYPDRVMEIQRLEATYKGSAVINAFKKWVDSHVYDEIRNPVSAFLREADEILGGDSPAKNIASDPEVGNLARELSYLSGGVLQFDNRQKAMLQGHVRDGFAVEEITAAFRDFFSSLDKNDARAVKFAAKTFAETADQLAYANRRRAEAAQREAEAIARHTAKREQEVAAEQEAWRKKKLEEESLVEETLS